jgi:Skp family chaperone for outer membrane proteins
VDEIKAQFNAEEQELARLRPTMERSAFDARVAEFDRNVRRERRQTQFRAAALQTAFRDARLKFVEALTPILEEVRAEHGATLILNADQALATDRAADVTDEVIERINLIVPVPPLPDLDELDPGPEMPLEESGPEPGTVEPGVQ